MSILDERVQLAIKLCNDNEEKAKEEATIIEREANKEAEIAEAQKRISEVATTREEAE